MTINSSKYLIYLLICLLFIFVGCSSPEPTATPAAEVEVTETTTRSELKSFTIEELSSFNGKDGQPAYVSVNGMIYDLTDVPSWQNGKHNGIEAGQDVTDAIMNKSPHGPKVLDNLVPIGTLKE